MRNTGGIAALCIILMLLYPKEVLGEKPDMISLLKASDAQFLKIEVEGSAEFHTKDTLNQIGINLLKKSGYDDFKEMEAYEDRIIIKSSSAKGEGLVLCKKLDGENLIYASLTLSHYDEERNINNTIRRTISKAFWIYNSKPSFSSLVQGKYDCIKDNNEMRIAAKKVFSSCEGSIYEGIDDENIISLSGYSPYFNDCISYMGRKINLNTALRYSKSDSCTYIWIASPLILREY